MKRTLLILLASTGLGWSEPTIYHTLPSPECQLQVIGQATVITDARGFFVGYYRPRRPPAPAFTPVATQKPGLWQGISGGGSGYNYAGDSDWSGDSSGGDCGGGQSPSSSQSSGGSEYASNSGSPLCSPDYGFGR